jgi:hypothetical protein
MTRSRDADDSSPLDQVRTVSSAMLHPLCLSGCRSSLRKKPSTMAIAPDVVEGIEYLDLNPQSRVVNLRSLAAASGSVLTRSCFQRRLVLAVST